MVEETEIYLKFKCPKCGDTRLEEVCTEVVQSCICEFITEEGIVDYGNTSYDGGGELSHYQCMQCAYILQNEGYNCPVSEGRDLAKWLKQNCPQDEE